MIQDLLVIEHRRIRLAFPFWKQYCFNKGITKCCLKVADFVSTPTITVENPLKTNSMEHFICK